MRALEPAVQSFIFNCLRAKVEDNLSKNLINTPDCFILASYYINGYGTKVDFKEAMRLIQQSSNMEYDHHSSRTYAYRIFKALDPNYVPNSDTISNLSVMAVRGARMAAADLKDVAPEEYLKIESLIRDVHAGVGADFFYDEQMLYIGTYWQWINTFDNPQVLVERLSKFDQIAEYRVNKRGDKILHLAASAGKIEAIETLLNNFPSFSINQLNDQGETPLLYACRAGQRKTALRLLELGADAAIIAANGESCLHWLVSFNDNEICPIGEALIKSGAGLRVYTRERIEHSQLRAKIDVAFQFPGTPLNWAVHHDRPCIIKFILDQASDASVCLDWPTDLLGRSTPLEFAAFFHHVECLKLMMDALDRAGMDYSLSPIITAGTNAADVFSMVLRNGSSYRDRLHEFLDLCLKKSKDIVFATGVGGLDTHLLYYAVSEGHDEVVEYLLSAKVSELVESLDIQCGEGQTCPGAYNASDINRPARGDRRTPVLEAIRWNRKHIVETLVASGADPKAAARNPFSAKEMNWTGLHIFAAAGHDENHSELVSFLIQAGLPIDGIPNSPDGTQQSPETPFLVTIQHNAFNLATTLLYFGANPNALQTSAGFFSLEHPTTVLGHIVASSSQHTIPRLRYLLETCPKSGAIDFIVEPTRGLSALHRAAWAHKGIMYRTPDAGQRKYLPREDYDFVMNQNIIQELLQHWDNRDVHLDRRCGIHGRTALHLAVDAGNIMGVEVLLSNKADRFVSDDFGMPPIELGREKSNAARDESSEERGIYDSIIKLLLR
jgi:ankyrin repeat protein